MKRRDFLKQSLGLVALPVLGVAASVASISSHSQLVQLVKRTRDRLDAQPVPPAEEFVGYCQPVELPDYGDYIVSVSRCNDSGRREDCGLSVAELIAAHGETL